MARRAHDDPWPEIKHPKQRAFLGAYAHLGTIRGAARAAGCNRSMHDLWRKKGGKPGERYRAAFRRARAEFADRIEQEAIRRATVGSRRLVTYKGKPVFVWTDAQGRPVPADTPGAKRAALYDTRQSDLLTICILKRVKRAYRDALQISGPRGKPIEVEQHGGDIDRRIQELVDELLPLGQAEAARRAGRAT